MLTALLWVFVALTATGEIQAKHFNSARACNWARLEAISLGDDASPCASFVVSLEVGADPATVKLPPTKPGPGRPGPR